MQLVALTGGIASGKSTIAHRLQQRGAFIIDADTIAREVVEPGEPALSQIVETFGQQVLTRTGQMDRARVAQLVFQDQTLLRQLNEIVHPAVQERVEERIAQIERMHPQAVIVYDVPLLHERSTGGIEWDTVVVAEAPDEVRVERMVQHRGMGEADARARISNQISNEERRALADIIIDTSGSIEDTLTRSDELWSTLNRDA